MSAGPDRPVWLPHDGGEQPAAPAAGGATSGKRRCGGGRRGGGRRGSNTTLAVAAGDGGRAQAHADLCVALAAVVPHLTHTIANLVARLPDRLPDIQPLGVACEALIYLAARFPDTAALACLI